MRYALSAVLVALALGACAGTPEDEDRTAARREAERELERECRMVARQGRQDPRCPEGRAGQPPPQDVPLGVPNPQVRVPLPPGD